MKLVAVNVLCSAESAELSTNVQVSEHTTCPTVAFRRRCSNLYVSKLKKYVMPLIIPVRGFAPQIAKDCFIAENATIIGDVIIGDESSIWFNAVIRGDVNSIRIGHRVNVQDGAVIHCTYEKSAVIIRNNVSVGHNAIIHGCVIDDNVLIGMGAIVMDNAHIGSNSIVAAGAVILANTVVEPGSMYAGVPAKKIKDVRPEHIAGEIERIAANYLTYSSWFK